MTDEEIVKRIIQGDHEMFPQLIDRYKDKIFALVYRYTNDYGEAQDIAQEVFIKIYKQMHTFRFQSKVSTWLYRVATNSCIDWSRKRKTKQDTTYLINEELVMDQERGPEQLMILNEQREAVRDVINRLPENYKLLIIMYHFQNMRYKEISEVLDMPMKTIETGLYRARAMIKKQMEIHYGGGELLWSARK
ncbi:RNA polymerase sigma-70 factor (ECF subfamily) [Anaerosolibacter carboniphilus]|uniref:RNA polymerase sigma factor n=1 Tax=Anaerosolibacter carboniphilus TaxID=1417629 RepID=A0A841KYJ0_9FIRM|nr:sigma-70 family RNA polymerase sigma factor [Anaerosolibacter carboniphilus]MBB6218694.1 RNA polymerase sigma-70 factor (ECF subfamily) [Anaerosolibacter carboniphilus]